MSRQKLIAGGKVTLKNTRDGLVERNEATGEVTRAGKREAEFDLRGKAPEGSIFTQARQQMGNKRKQARQRINSTEKPTIEEAKTDKSQESLANNPASPLSMDNPDRLMLVQVVAAPAIPSKKAPLITGKPDKLQFAPDETAPDAPKIHHNRKPNKAQKQADHTAKKLETAKSKHPKKRKLSAGRVIDEKTGMAKRKLYFESDVKSKAVHLKGPLPPRPVKAAGNAASVLGHRKMFQVERENVGTEAAHRGEMLAEGVIRSALRSRKAAPYRKVEGLGHVAAQKATNLNYQKALNQNPKFKSNIITRALQKRKIKKGYAKSARETQKAAKQAKKTGSAVAQAGKAVTSAIKRHPLATMIALLILLLLYTLISLFGAFASIGGGSLGGILSAMYLAEEIDINHVGLVYTEWETSLREQIANTENTYPNYDEYRYSIGEISHDPFGLMAYLTAKYQGFTYSEVEAELLAIFGGQYTLTFTPSVEARYRTVTKTDPNTRASYNVREAYDWHVMTVALAARPFSDIIMPRLSSEEYMHYELLMQTKGSRQYIGSPFGFDWLPYITSYYGYRIHPISNVVNLHRGLDIGVPQGTGICSGQDGTVTFAGYSGDFGNVVVIDNGKGLVSKYAHCGSLLVAEGQAVKTGDIIATVGSTGSSTGPHLHLEVVKDGSYLNPIFFTSL